MKRILKSLSIQGMSLQAEIINREKIILGFIK